MDGNWRKALLHRRADGKISFEFSEKNQKGKKQEEGKRTAKKVSANLYNIHENLFCFRQKGEIRVSQEW